MERKNKKKAIVLANIRYCFPLADGVNILRIFSLAVAFFTTTFVINFSLWR